MTASLISIIGPVGAGKTTLADLLAEDLGADVIYEDYQGNPFLAETWSGRDEMLLPCQLHFLLTRLNQLAEARWPADGLFVSDYGFCQNRMFAEAKLPAGQLALYDRVESELAGLVKSPDVLIHLDASVSTLRQRIARRGRGYEAGLDEEFLAFMRQAHFDVPTPAGCRRIEIDVDTVDLLDADVRRGVLESLDAYR